MKVQHRTNMRDDLPMACAIFDVDMTRTFLRCLSLSSCVSSAFTTCSFHTSAASTICTRTGYSPLTHQMARFLTWHLHELPLNSPPHLGDRHGVSVSWCSKPQQREHSPISTTTNTPSSSTISVTRANNFWTNFPDSENHLEKRE